LFLGWSLLWSLGFSLFLELLLWSLLWSLGLTLFLELLLASAMLQGSHFLLLVHFSRTESKLLELFYHIARGVQGSPEEENPTQDSKIKGQKSK